MVRPLRQFTDLGLIAHLADQAKEMLQLVDEQLAMLDEQQQQGTAKLAEAASGSAANSFEPAARGPGPGLVMEPASGTTLQRAQQQQQHGIMYAVGSVGAEGVPKGAEAGRAAGKGGSSSSTVSTLGPPGGVGFLGSGSRPLRDGRDGLLGYGMGQNSKAGNALDRGHGAARGAAAAGSQALRKTAGGSAAAAAGGAVEGGEGCANPGLPTFALPTDTVRWLTNILRFKCSLKEPYYLDQLHPDFEKHSSHRVDLLGYNSLAELVQCALKMKLELVSVTDSPRIQIIWRRGEDGARTSLNKLHGRKRPASEAAGPAGCVRKGPQGTQPATLPREVTKEELTEAFSGCGGIVQTTVFHARSGASCGYVVFNTPSEAALAISRMHGYPIRGEAGGPIGVRQAYMKKQLSPSLSRSRSHHQLSYTVNYSLYCLDNQVR
eukprot:gene5851-6092_t